jgi:hypothetical protein
MESPMSLAVVEVMMCPMLMAAGGVMMRMIFSLLLEWRLSQFQSAPSS